VVGTALAVGAEIVRSNSLGSWALADATTSVDETATADRIFRRENIFLLRGEGPDKWETRPAGSQHEATVGH
jgi:hypothetical protein